MTAKRLLELSTEIRENLELSSYTSFGLGGPARYFIECQQPEALIQGMKLAYEDQLATYILGHGSNLLVADEGLDAAVFKWAGGDIRILEEDSVSALVEVDAGVSWDLFVEWTLAHGLSSLASLSGIPGCVGAAPIQNIGAYGGELSDHLLSLKAFDLFDEIEREFRADQCGFSYRSSHFKTLWSGRFLILSLRFSLAKESTIQVSYSALAQRIGERVEPHALRRSVLAVRREKSMLDDSKDPNARSAGSFFTNPIIQATSAKELSQAYPGLPVYPMGSELAKLPAARLIEMAGFERGHQHGQAGLSAKHTLAIINRGQARAQEVIELAAQIRYQVWRQFGVVLVPEPQFLGFAAGPTGSMVLDSLAPLK